jgi:hypothetical protein
VLGLAGHGALFDGSAPRDRKIGAVDINDLLPGIFATLASAGLIALVAFMMPAVRWSRQLAREVGILGGLPDGDERNAWEKRVVAHARRLRLFQEVMPWMDKVFPWFPVILFVGSIAWAILDPRQIDGFLAEGPFAICIALAALVSVVLYIVTGVMGLSPSGKSGEDHARRRGLLADEASRRSTDTKS